MFGKNLLAPRFESSLFGLLDTKDRIVLLDNGSLRPEATFSLRGIASRFGELLGRPVHPVSLLHSSKIPAEKLGGEAAQTWRRFLKREVAAGARRFLVAPLFFGPSSAFVDYLPRVTEQILGGESPVSVEVAKPLVDLDDPADDAVARILVDLLVQKLDTKLQLLRPTIILVDHGSPVEKVAACRDLVARQMEELLGSRVSRVIASSMERRDGDEYAFSEPLLERVLHELAQEDASAAALSLMFFSPGRHAGPGGDIAKIVEASAWSKSGRVLPATGLVGESRLLPELLVRRFQALELRLS